MPTRAVPPTRPILRPAPRSAASVAGCILAIGAMAALLACQTNNGVVPTGSINVNGDWVITSTVPDFESACIAFADGYLAEWLDGCTTDYPVIVSQLVTIFGEQVFVGATVNVFGETVIVILDLMLQDDGTFAGSIRIKRATSDQFVSSSATMVRPPAP